MSLPNPCLQCGACCAWFRVSFYWAESTAGGGPVPDELTEQVSPFHLAMKGTARRPARCVALEGQPGGPTRCAIHPQRSSTCRDFRASWSDGAPAPDCDRARAAWGLPPLVPEDWQPR
jgi:uncharacterized protein